MSRLLLLLSLALLFAKGFSRHEHKSHESEKSKIVGGNATTISQFNYQALVLPTTPAGTYICGGSIISPKYVLSAAHCTFGALKIGVITGSSFMNGSSGSFSYTYTYSIHPLYSPFSHNYDVSVIQLNKPLATGPNVGLIQLPPSGYEVPSGTPAIVTGWGTTAEGGQISPDLQSAVIPIVNNTYCQQEYASYSQSITQNMLCAGKESGGVDSCQGDSGGPLVVSLQHKYLVGIVSFGIGCGRPEIPGVYTKVAAPKVRSWIKQKTGV